jgi:hypothetical protein
MTGKSVYVCTDYREKQLQRALLQFTRPENANLVREALKIAGREDLIGSTADCLVRAAFGKGQAPQTRAGTKGRNGEKSYQSSKDSRAARKRGAIVNKNANVTKKSGRSVMERAFGEDAARIRKEAERLASKGSGTSSFAKTNQSGRSYAKSSVKGKKRR